MGGFVRFLALLLLALLVRLFFVNWLRPRTARRQSVQRQKTPRTGTMLRDPHCGTYVASELAIPAITGGQTLHFCSQQCRDLYLESLQ